MAEARESSDAASAAGPAEIDDSTASARVPAAELLDFICQLGDENLSAMMREAIRLEKKYGFDHSRAIDALCQVAHACEDTGWYDVSFEIHLAAAQGIVEAVGTESEAYASTLASLGELSRKLEKLEDAADYLRQAVQVQQTVTGPQHPHLAFMQNSLAGVLTQLGKFEEAKKISDKSLDIFNAELLESICVRDLDTGEKIKLSEVEKFLPKGVNPIELHSLEEILSSCLVKNLDTGDATTLTDPNLEPPSVLQDVKDAVTTAVNQNLSVDSGKLAQPHAGVPVSDPNQKKQWTGSRLTQMLRRGSTAGQLSRKRSNRLVRRGSATSINSTTSTASQISTASTASTSSRKKAAGPSIIKIVVKKDPTRKIGLVFCPADSKTGLGVLIKAIKPDGIAASMKGFQPMQRILSIDGRNTREFTKPRLIELIKSSGLTTVEFGLEQPLNTVHTMERHSEPASPLKPKPKPTSLAPLPKLDLQKFVVSTPPSTPDSAIAPQQIELPAHKEKMPQVIVDITQVPKFEYKPMEDTEQEEFFEGD